MGFFEEQNARLKQLAGSRLNLQQTPVSQPSAQPIQSQTKKSGNIFDSIFGAIGSLVDKIPMSVLKPLAAYQTAIEKNPVGKAISSASKQLVGSTAQTYQIAKNRPVNPVNIGKSILGETSNLINFPSNIAQGAVENTLNQTPLKKGIKTPYGNLYLSPLLGLAAGLATPVGPEFKFAKEAQIAEGLLTKALHPEDASLLMKIIPKIQAKGEKLTSQEALDLQRLAENYLPKNFAVATDKTLAKTFDKVLEAKKVPSSKAIEQATARIENIASDLKTNPDPYLQKVGMELEKIGKEQTPIEALMGSLKAAKPTRAVQEQLYTQARYKSFNEGESAFRNAGGGLAGYQAKLSKFRGPLQRVQFEPLADKLSASHQDQLINSIENNTLLNGGDKLTGQRGLINLFRGVVPTQGEIKILDKAFGPELTKELLNKRPFLNKLTEEGVSLINVPKSLMSAGDFSMSFRQALPLISRPKEFFSAMKSQVGYAFNKGSFEKAMQEITQRPNFPLMQEFKLAITDIGKGIANREEAFISKFAEKIPGIQASERAYIGGLNKLRADVFDSMLRDALNQGVIKLGANSEVLEGADVIKNIANFINVASGRGSLGLKSLEKAAPALNAAFFSPRLIASRLTLLNPAYYARLDPFTRRQALKSLFSVISLGATTLTLAKLAGADIGINPTSSDFGKIKIGNTRIDVWGGFQQYIRSLAQIVSGKYTSSTTGKEIQLGEGYNATTRKDILQRVVESKLAPVPAFLNTYLQGKNIEGQPPDFKAEALTRITPFLLQDTYDLIKEDPRLVPISVLDAFGVGVQTYGPSTNSNSAFKSGRSIGSNSGRKF